jgi:hypothetical protein
MTYAYKRHEYLLTFQPIPAFWNETLQKEVYAYARQNLVKLTTYIKVTNCQSLVWQKCI